MSEYEIWQCVNSTIRPTQSFSGTYREYHPSIKDGIYVSLRKHLDERPWILTCDTILIEKQPDRNKKMVSVMHFLHAYFVIKGA